MKLGSKKGIAAVLAALALAGGIGAGAALGGKHRAHGGLLRVAAQYIGVSRGELLRDLRTGQTLAQVASGHGKTSAGLQSALLGAVKDKLDAAVAAGKLTSAQEQTRLAHAQQLIERFVNAKIAEKGKRARGRLLGVAARYIGITPKALAAELEAGRSLAAAASAHGKTVEGLKTALLQPFKARLDKALAAGRITPPGSTGWSRERTDGRRWTGLPVPRQRRRTLLGDRRYTFRSAQVGSVASRCAFPYDAADMATGVRDKITLACNECKRRNYMSTKSKRNTPDRLEVRKYCRWCGHHTAHRETR